MLTQIDKFLVAVIGTALTLGIVPDGTWQTVAGAITAVLVYLVPNGE